MILTGQAIKANKIIFPHVDRQVAFGMTYGESVAGYDVRVEFDEDGIQYERVMEPQDLLIASTIEQFSMPPGVIGIVHDKSTWARRGLTVQNTVIEPGWRGFLTLELVNHSKEPIILNRGMPIAQVLFHQTTGLVQIYDGKYQDQKRGPVEAILE